MNIRPKLTLLFLVIALIPASLVSALTFHAYRESLEADKLSNFRNIAVFKAGIIETYFRNLRVYFELSQATYAVKKNLPVLIQLVNNPANPEFIAAKKMIDDVFGNIPSSLGLLDVMLLDPQGKVVYSSNPGHSLKEFLNFLPDPQKKAFFEGKNKVYLSEIFFQKVHNDSPVMLMTGPAHDFDGNFIGVIAIEVDMLPVYKMIQDVTGLGKTGETLIGKKVGERVIFLNPLRNEPEAALRKSVGIGDKIGLGIQDAAQGKTGSGAFIDYRGKQVIGAWRYIPALGWGVVAKIDSQEAFAEIGNLRDLVLLILGIIFVLCGISAFSIARSISGPIKKLAKGARVVGGGDLDYRLALNSRDEIGQLARAFDKMTADLKAASLSRDIEKKRLYGVLEALPVYVVLLSEDYRVPFANKFFRERFGESGGKRCYEYLFKRAEPCENCETYKVMKTGSRHHWEWTGPDNRNYDIYDFPFTDSDGSRMILEMGIDVTERKKAEAEIEKHRHHLEELVNERTIQLKAEIAERGRAEDALRESERRMQRAQDIAHLGSWELDLTANSLSWSDETYRIFGFKPQEFKSTYAAFLEAVHPDDRIAVDKAYSASLREEKESYEIEHRIVRKSDGEIRFVHEKCEHIKDASGKVIRSVGMVHDITGRKRAEESLAKAHAELERKVAERTSQLLEANELLNLEIVGRQKIEHEIRARNSLLRLAARSNTRKEYLDAVVRLLRGWSGVRCAGIRLLNEDGSAPYESSVGFSGEFWQKENRLSVNNDKCLCIRAITGEFRPEDAGTVTPYGSFYCRDTSEFVSRLSEAQKSQLRGQCVKEGFKSLTIIPIRFKEKIIGAIHLADEKKDLPGPETINSLELLAMRVGEDIIKFNLADRMNKSAEFLGKVFSTTNFHIAYMDVNFNFIRVNQAYAERAHQSPDLLTGKSYFDVFPDKEDEAIFRNVMQTGEAYVSFDKPFICRIHPERRVTYWDWSLQPLKDTSGKAEGLLLFLVDTTKRKEVEEELISTQIELVESKRLSDIGTLAATVAHELRNPLAAIQMASYNIKRKAQNPILDKHLLTIENKVNESEQIISNLLFYSRLRPPKYENIGMDGIINECITLVRKRFAKEKVSLQANLNPLKQVSIEADPLQMREVFGNILNNAYESQTKEEKRVEINTEINNGYIGITVKDAGEGIDRHNLERIFDPFFTTKARGTGLGLTVCKQIINFHGGSIDIQSEKGKGTLVSIRLPIKKEPPS